MQILDKVQIERKLSRLAIEILERHVHHKELFLIGINNNGYSTAELLKTYIDKEGYDLSIQLRRIRLSPANPLHGGISLEGNATDLDGKHIVLVDDVANTGRTAFYATLPIKEIVPQSLEVAVLVDRKHKKFPTHCDYVGLSLATTLENDIRVYYDDNWRVEVF